MHPEIVQEGPGPCPICGMALEPMGVPPEITDNPELRDFTRRLMVAVPLSLALLAIDMASHVFGLDLLPFLVAGGEAMAAAADRHSGRALGRLAVLRARLATRSASGHLNMFTLIALGTGAAFLYSLVAILAPGIFPAAMRDHHGLVPVYFEAAAVIVALVLLGQVLELRARERTGGAIRALLDLAPKTALRVLPDGKTETSPAREGRKSATCCACAPATRCRSTARRRGQKRRRRIACSPASRCRSRKVAGDRVTGGTLNGTGSFDMRVDRTGAETTLGAGRRDGRRRRSARARRSRRWPTRCPAISCRR